MKGAFEREAGQRQGLVPTIGKTETACDGESGVSDSEYRGEEVVYFAMLGIEFNVSFEP